MDRSDVVLVHGLYHQAVHMEPLAEELRARGITVRIPRLHRGSLADDVHAVQSLVDQCDSPPIAVGHSYGGAVITALANVSGLVYIAAFVPDTDESCASLGDADALVNEWVRPHPSGGTYIRAEDAARLFYGGCPPERAAWAAAHLVPQRPGHGRGMPQRAAWKTVDSVYVICADDRAVSPTLQRDLARRCRSSIELKSDHSPYIAAPALLADVIGRTGSDCDA